MDCYGLEVGFWEVEMEESDSNIESDYQSGINRQNDNESVFQILIVNFKY